MDKWRGYNQFCPVAKAAEIFAERWTPLVLRDLMPGPRRFNELRMGIALISPSMLSQRLKELEWAGVVAKRPCDGTGAYEYRLTEVGRELEPVIMQLGIWGHRWIQAEIGKEDLDASLLMWAMSVGVNMERLPKRRVVVKFSFPDAPRAFRRWWLLLHPEGTDVCIQHPGFEIDLEVDTALLTMTRIWQGDLKFDEAIRSGDLIVTGPPNLARQFPRWFKLSDFAKEERLTTPEKGRRKEGQITVRRRLVANSLSR